MSLHKFKDRGCLKLRSRQVKFIDLSCRRDSGVEYEEQQEIGSNEVEKARNSVGYQLERMTLADQMGDQLREMESTETVEQQKRQLEVQQDMTAPNPVTDDDDAVKRWLDKLSLLSMKHETCDTEKAEEQSDVIKDCQYVRDEKSDLEGLAEVKANYQPETNKSADEK